MKKKVLAAVLAAVLLASLTGTCLAETLSIAGFSRSTYTNDGRKVSCQWYTAFQQAYPAVRLNITKKLSASSAKALLQSLEKKSFKYDVFVVRSDRIDLEALITSGRVADVTEHPEVAALLEQMYPALTEAVTVQGRAYGVPCNVQPLSFLAWNPSSWRMAGFDPADVPSSFEGLLDFLDAWIIRCETDPIPDVCVTNAFDEKQFNQNSYTLWLLETLVSQYIHQCEAQGVPIQFDTAQWRTLAERIRATGAGLYRAERPFESDNPLFEQYSLAEMLPYYVPTRLNEDAPICIPVQMSVMCIPAVSDMAEMACKFIQVYFSCMTDRQYDLFHQVEEDAEMVLCNALLFQHVHEPVPSASYSAPAYWEGMIAQAQAIVDDPTTSAAKRKRYEANLARYEEKQLVEKAYDQQYAMDEAELARYQALTPSLCVAKPGALDTGDAKLKRILRQYAAGKLTVDELVVQLDAFVASERSR